MERSSEPKSADALDPQALESLLDLLGNDTDALGEIVDAFLEEGPARVAEARDGVARNDAVLAGRAAHTLKSNALTFGAQALADVSRRVEESARTGDVADWRAGIRCLHDTCMS